MKATLLRRMITSLVTASLATPIVAPRLTHAVHRPVFTEFRATLLQANEAPAVPFTGAYGMARMTFERTTRRLSYTISVTGIVSATAAHIHRGPIGANGPVVFDLLGAGVLSSTSPLSGAVYLTPAQVADLFAGNYYVNVHTAAHPGGELRGQLFPREAIRAFGTQLSGDAEVPPLISANSGSALILLSDAQDQFAFFLQVTGVPSATIAGIYEAPVGSNGPLAFDLLALGGGTLNPTTPISGTSPISPTRITALRDGNLYVSVGTALHPTGEMRGQLGPNEVLLRAMLSGANEVPPVATLASGQATFDLMRSTGQLPFAVTVTGIPSATMAHIHKGPAGVNGPVVVDLLAAGSGQLSPATPLIGTAIVTATTAVDLLTANAYVNIHTVAHPTGEIRGQVEPPRRFLTYRAELSGANELPTPIATAATGLASLVLDSLTNALTYKIVTDSMTSTVTGMHIHTGTITETGGIAFNLDLSGTGVVTLTNDQVYRLTTGGYYINVHTTDHPGGEIRGQIYPVAVSDRYFGAMTGARESPPVTTTASGSAFFVLDVNRTELSYKILINTAAPVVTAVHIRRGAPGQNGPILYTLYSSTSAFGPGTLAGKIGITPGDLNCLLLNMLYVNVQTVAYPAGEIRGDVTEEQRMLLPITFRIFPAPPGQQSGATPGR
ncbi:MAG: hypothetical protein KatS3mg053_3385 [Candidatus Roseilinea sp.]|nr:MAG: hypothetical protein KatS3mg053_3385 [Candidatus Roseilinea sp.]